MRSLLPCLALLAGCAPFGLGGTVAGVDVSFEDAVFFDLRGVDPGDSVPFHDLDLWLMPVDNACETLPALLDELAALRERVGFGLSSTDYCDQWEGIWDSYGLLREFQVGHVRLSALPRAEGESVATDYTFWDDFQAAQPDGPSWDLDLALYPTPDFAACATEFEGTTTYGPTLHAATGGEARVTRYTEDQTLGTRIDPTVEGGEDALRGGSTADFCIGAEDWPLVFGLGT
jgi:hypothetical protein